MQGGDISAEYEPTLLVLFEGLLGLPPKEAGRKSWWKRRKSDAASVVADYEINMLLLHQIERVRYPVEVVTFLGPQFVVPIEQRLEDLHALVRRVWYTTPQDLSRIHLKLPDVVAIFDPDPLRATFSYGGLGRHMLPEQSPRFGAI